MTNAQHSSGIVATGSYRCSFSWVKRITSFSRVFIMLRRKQMLPLADPQKLFHGAYWTGITSYHPDSSQEGALTMSSLKCFFQFWTSLRLLSLEVRCSWLQIPWNSPSVFGAAFRTCASASSCGVVSSVHLTRRASAITEPHRGLLCSLLWVSPEA